MTPRDNQTLLHWVRTLTPDGEQPAMTLAPGRDQDRSVPFNRFCDEFRQAVPVLRFKRDDQHPSGLPTILPGRTGNIAFQMIPTGKWLGFFLDALTPMPGTHPTAPGAADGLPRLRLPLALDLYVSHHCPHCPAHYHQLLPLARANALVRLTVIDAALFPESAHKDQVRAVPTLLMEDQFRWTGPIDPEEILDLAVQRDPAKLSAASLGQFLEAGRAQQAAAMMIERGLIFPALLDLLTDEKWPKRLAAMVTVECLAGDAPQLSQTLIDPLWHRFAKCPPTVKGDLAYVLGLIPSDQAVIKLQAIAAREPDAGVREAALEALDARLSTQRHQYGDG